MKSYLSRLGRPDPRLVLAAIFSVIVLHILATFAASGVALSSAYDRLAPALKPNTMVVLPAVTPDTQPLPFMAPDARVALCKFDTSRAKIAINASLPAPGWTLTLYDPHGAAIYTAVAQSGRRTDIALTLVPDDDRFLGLSPEALGQKTRKQARLNVQARKGIAVLRAPDAGLAYRARDEAELQRANCRVSTDG